MPNAQSKGFVEEAKAVLHDVRTSLASLLESVGADPAQPQEMSRRFSLDKTLTWKIARIVCDDDAWSAAAHIPGRAGLGQFIDTIERAGAPSHSAQLVRIAMEKFEQLVEVHSGDRDTFEIMVGGISEPLARRQNEAFRKMSYQGNSATWGIQAKTQLSIQFMAPNAHRPDRLDFAIVCGLLDFRRLRHDAPWAVASRVSISDDGTPQDNENTLSPLDPSLSNNDIPILRQFCSDPLPTLRAINSGGKTRYEFTEGPVGNTAAATCILGWLTRAAADMYRTDDDRFGELMVYLSTPVETFIHDIYIHRSLTFALKPDIFVYSAMPGGPTYPRDGRDRGLIPAHADIINLGSPPDTTLVGLPRYSQMTDFAVAQLGHSIRDFHGFRFRLRYPPIPSIALYRHDLPTRP